MDGTFDVSDKQMLVRPAATRSPVTADIPILAPTITRHVYHRHVWEDHTVAPPRSIPIYVCEPLTLGDALQRLIDNYRPEKAS